MTMAESVVNGDHGLDTAAIRRNVLSNSTKRRATELHAVKEQLSNGLPESHLSFLLNIIFDTYPLFVDALSRQAAEECLSAIASTPDAAPALRRFIDDLSRESVKPTIAPANAFVLIRWSSLFIQHAALKRQLWESQGKTLISTLTNALNTLFGRSPKASTLSTALRVSRRAVRALTRSEWGLHAIDECISMLTAKAPGPTPQNAILLGIIAGVCKRLPSRTLAVESRKQDYVSFYLREILGSRVPLPDYIGKALRDYFSGFVTLDALQRDIIPAIEKALLRAPEVVLNDLVSPVIASLPDDIDLSEILLSNLLKPLLSNIKSTNSVIRDGALHFFEVVASRCKDDALVGKVGEEILTPLKNNKVASADQRVIHARMLSSLKLSPSLGSKVQTGLVSVAAKEANEAAASAELHAIEKGVGVSLKADIKPEAAVIDAFSKGIADKRMPMRRLWTLSFANIFVSSEPGTLSLDATKSLLDPCIGKLIEDFNEVAANPMPAVSTGQIPVACAITVLCSEIAPSMAELKNAPMLKKADVAGKALALSPKPSFLWNPRVYTRLTAGEDLRWHLRAILATWSSLADHSVDSTLSIAWAQVMIYLITASIVPPRIRNEAVAALKKLYKSDQPRLSQTITKGLWQWCEDVEIESKESAAIAAKTGRAELYKVVGAICPDDLKQSATEDQMIGLLILCQPQLIPRASWIELCLRTGTDPGALAAKSSKQCLAEVLTITESPIWRPLPAFQTAAFSAAAELAFVAPTEMTPLLVAQIERDLDPLQLEGIGPMETAIYRTPDDTAFVDVLSKQPHTQVAKSAKDYETLKWEEDLRAQLAAKKGQAKKLTADEQKKVNEQLAKEAVIRQDVAAVDARLRRGVGMISGLATGPPTEAEAWFGPAVTRLFEVIQAGAGLIIGDTAALSYLLCANRISPRLSSMKPFVGVATLRAAGVTILPENLMSEPLADLITRVLYRVRFLGEQRPFDTITLSYILPLIFLVLGNGGVGSSISEDADEQIVLAIEFLSFHTEVFSDSRLPRKRVLTTCTSAMQRYTQHFRLFRDCFMELCRSMGPNMAELETDSVVKGSIVPEPSVRGAVLQAISAELELEDRDFYEEIWLACHDAVVEDAEIAHEIWEENNLKVPPGSAILCLPYLTSRDPQLRGAAARSIASCIRANPSEFSDLLTRIEATYMEDAKPRKPELDKYGMPVKKDLTDPWESRHGIGLTFKALASLFPADQLEPFFRFLIENGPLGDANGAVRDSMLQAAREVADVQGKSKVEALMALCESTLASPASSSQTQDLVNEAVVIIYGALAQHLPEGDLRIPQVVQRLLSTLSTPSESVQYAVSQCLPALVRASIDRVSDYLQHTIDETLHAKRYASRRGAAYGLAGIVQGKGISILKDNRVISTLKSATENRKDANERQGAFLAYELLSLILGKVFEPYVILVMPQLLAGFGDSSADVREACLEAAKTCFAHLSSFGVKQVLPILLEGLREQQWRSKKGASDSLGAMAYLDPEQLAISLPDIIPPLTEVLNDSHKEVRASANRSLQRFGDVITNPEVKSQVNILLKALSDPTKYTDEALDALIKVNFVHYLDAPSLALVVRILERGLGDRSATKRKSAQIIGSLAHLTERRDLITHLPPLIAGLRTAIVDPVPTTRATASKALGSTIEKLGEDALPDLIPSLMQTLKSDTGAGDRLGSAQALSEVLAGLGTTRLEQTLPTILENVTSRKASVREGFMSLFIFLPACFGQSFATYLSQIIPPILGGLADDIESIRETALRAGRLLVKNFAARSVDLLLPELERGLADNSYRIRLSSVELVGDLLFNLTGISARTEDEEVADNANEAGQSLLEVLGEEKRNKVLSALYICRCDTSGLVRTAAINIWKALVSTPRTLRELVPTLTQLLIRRLASDNSEQRIIAGNALGELIRKAGDNVLSTLLPTLQEGLEQTMETSARQGICMALRELIAAAAPESLEEYEKTLISVVRTALVDRDNDVREAAADAFDSLQRVLGKRAVDQVLPYLLQLLRSEEDAAIALAALLTLLKDNARSNSILPNLLPTLTTSPISAFNARALASLAKVTRSTMNRRLPHILNALLDNIVICKDESLKLELDAALDAIMLSVDESDGLTTLMSVMLQRLKDDDHRRRAEAGLHLAKFFEGYSADYSRYYPDLILALLNGFDDSDPVVVKASWTALTALVAHLRKEEMESLVVSTRQALKHVGVAGHDLPGFSLPKGINAILPIFLQGLMNGSAEQRTQAALAISDLVDRTSAEGLRASVTQITGPLIRVVSERSTDLKAAILLTLNNLLEKIPTFLKPFLPQLQRTFAKSLADPSSEVLRSRAAKALGTLITMTPRIDPLIAELVTGSKTSDAGVRNAMLKALYEVVSKSGAKMSDTSRNSILSLIDADSGENNDALDITYAKLFGALIKVLPPDAASGLAEGRVLTTHFTHASILALNAILLESPETLTQTLGGATQSVIVQGIADNQPFISDNSVLAAGKYLLEPSSNKSFEATKPLIEALSNVIAPGNPLDTRRLALVVIRTVSREHPELIRPHLATIVPAVFASVRDTVIPVKLSAEAAFLAIFNVVEEESALFDKYMAGPGTALPPPQKRSMQEYFKRIALRLSSQAKERMEAQGGAGGLGLDDEMDDLNEIRSVGRMDLGEDGGGFD